MASQHAIKKAKFQDSSSSSDACRLSSASMLLQPWLTFAACDHFSAPNSNPWVAKEGSEPPIQTQNPEAKPTLPTTKPRIRLSRPNLMPSGCVQQCCGPGRQRHTEITSVLPLAICGRQWKDQTLLSLTQNPEGNPTSL